MREVYYQAFVSYASKEGDDIQTTMKRIDTVIEYLYTSPYGGTFQQKLLTLCRVNPGLEDIVTKYKFEHKLKMLLK